MRTENIGKGFGTVKRNPCELTAVVIQKSRRKTDVELNGDTARMTGRSRVVAAVYGSGKSSWRLQGDFTLRKEEGGWKFTGSKASTY